jgi:hypothetical protein
MDSDGRVFVNEDGQEREAFGDEAARYRGVLPAWAQVAAMKAATLHAENDED